MGYNRKVKEISFLQSEMYHSSTQDCDEFGQMLPIVDHISQFLRENVAKNDHSLPENHGLMSYIIDDLYVTDCNCLLDGKSPKNRIV